MQTLAMTVLPTLMILAAASDVTSYRIPNWLTALTAALFFPMALVTGMPLQEFGYHLLGGAVLFVAGFALFSLGMFGGGDAKLMAAAGLWVGTSQTITFLFMTVLAGGVLTLVVMLWSYLSLWSEMEGKFWSGHINKLKPKVPYGFALAAGAILAYPQTWWLKDMI